MTISCWEYGPCSFDVANFPNLETVSEQFSARRWLCRARTSPDPTVPRPYLLVPIVVRARLDRAAPSTSRCPAILRWLGYCYLRFDGTRGGSLTVLDVLPLICLPTLLLVSAFSSFYSFGVTASSSTLRSMTYPAAPSRLYLAFSRIGFLVIFGWFPIEKCSWPRETRGRVLTAPTTLLLGILR